MYTLTPIDESLNKAFLLAHFINGNKDTAIRVVTGAMAKLEVAAVAQGKRLYYKPGGRSLLHRPRLDRFRNKVTFSELHLLQRLIYIESEPYERQKELASGGGAVGKEDMIIHFIKHLVRIALKRNSFYVTLGMSRLLYNYTTNETMGIYNVVVQDPERVKDDYYYRSRKGVLMQELKERFENLIKINRVQRGEERFQADPNPGKFAALVRECLSLFTPWSTTCSVPADFDPIMNGVPALSFKNENNEDEVELNRIHAVLHPDCYQRLTTAVGLQAPEDRLEVPHFFLSNENRNGGETVRSPTVGLGEEDLTAIKSDLNELAERRKKASAGFLQVRVDGTEYARLDLKSARRVRFNLEDWKELIEIWTTDKRGDLLLASHLLTSQEQGKAASTKSSIVLEGGQKLSIDVSPSRDASGPIVDIRYRETNPVKAISLVFQQLLTASAIDRLLFPGRGSLEGGRFKVLLPVSGFILLLVITVGVVTHLQRGRNQFDSRAISNGNQTQSSPLGQDAISENGSGMSVTPMPLSSPQKEGLIKEQPDTQSSRSTQPPAPPKPGSLTRDTMPNVDTARGQTSVEHPATRSETISSGEEVTRAVRRAEKSLSLRDVKSVFVEVVENEHSNQILREVLVNNLQVSDRLTLSKSRDDADAVLKISQMAASVFTAQLINAQGQVIWPIKGRRSQGTYSGLTAEQVGAQILQDLLADIDQLNGRR